jgi:ATP-binding cassette, subfamily B, bacterial MsbA
LTAVSHPELYFVAMTNIWTVMRFGWTYLRRYSGRLFLSILFAVVFGLSNASFIWATQTIIGRLKPETESSQPAAEESKRSQSQATGTTLSSLAPHFSERLIRFKQKIDRAVDSILPRVGEEMALLQILGGLFFLPCLVFVRSAADYGSSYCMGWVAERLVNDMRLDLLDKLSSLSLNFFNRSSTGDLLTRINSDTAKLMRALKVGAADMIKEPVTLVSVFIYLCWMNWKLTLFAMVFLPLCLFPLIVLGKKVRRASKASVNAEVLQAGQLVELLASMRIIKAYNLEHEQIRRFRSLSRQLVHYGMKNVQAKELVNPLIAVVSTVGLGALIVYAVRAAASVENVVGFLTGLILFYEPVKKLARIHVLFEEASVGVVRLMGILREEPTVKESPNPKPLPQFRNAITFENVSFAYADRPVIQRFDLTVPRGCRLGIAGPSGSGKSTLVNLVFRFYDPTDGAIRIDGTDLREASISDLRKLMALVSQEVILFDQTVAENIACGKLDASREEIETAARAAYAHDFIMQLPNGYDTRIGERGVTLSGGQRQRIAIARAFVRNAPILVLDEATASLDSQSEGEVQVAIERLAENRTVICVAHRLSTLASMHRILVLADGRLAEGGSFDELLESGGMFAAMARSQGIFASPSAPA